MDNLQKLKQQVQIYSLIAIIICNAIIILLCWVLSSLLNLALPLVGLLCLFATLILGFTMARAISKFATQPIEAIWQTILHLSPSEHGVAAADIEQLKAGRELVASLTSQVYQLSEVANKEAEEIKIQSSDMSHNFVAVNLPLPFFVLDNSENIIFANDAACQYIGMQSPAELIGKNIYMVLDMSFPSQDTFDTWLKEVKTKSAIATKTWERVRLNVRDNHPARLFDLASYYNRDNPDRNETMLLLFDHTQEYSQDDQAVSFMALSVHELRTPLTLLRGYIEVFEDEINKTEDQELKDFMLKMKSQADQLMAYVNNILNVARVDDDQLELQLEEQSWPEVLKSAIEALSLRAKVRDITLHCRIATDLPTVGVDRISIYEVINNLVDNAIKYSGNSRVIEINAHMTNDGLVETTVQDFGLGISSSIMPNLFTKFYRDHRNRAQIGGTGLGLYLSKAIVTAHGGTLWVRSKEGEGSTFGFTIVPYSQLADELKKSGNKDIVRNAHGWIKNHSLYRR